MADETPTNRIDPSQVRRGAFTENLGTDWIAVDDNGSILSRASDETAVRRAAPDAAGYFNAAMLGKLKAADLPKAALGSTEAALGSTEAALDAIKAQGVKAEDEPPVDGKAFDHDDKPGDATGRRQQEGRGQGQSYPQEVTLPNGQAPR